MLATAASSRGIFLNKCTRNDRLTPDCPHVPPEIRRVDPWQIDWHDHQVGQKIMQMIHVVKDRGFTKAWRPPLFSSLHKVLVKSPHHPLWWGFVPTNGIKVNNKWYSSWRIQMILQETNKHGSRTISPTSRLRMVAFSVGMLETRVALDFWWCFEAKSFI